MEDIVFAEPRYRFVAMILDLLLIEGLSEAVAFVASFLMKGAAPEAELLSELGIGLAVFLSYQTYFLARWGGSPGKLLFKIRVVDSRTLSPVTWRRALVRALAWIPAYLPFCMGLAVAVVHPERRGLHDLIAGTACLRRKRKKA